MKDSVHVLSNIYIVIYLTIFSIWWSPKFCHLEKSYTFPKWQILESFKLKQFADENSKFDENDRKLSKWVENTVGKGEIAHYEQFLFFPVFFKRLVL